MRKKGNEEEGSSVGEEVVSVMPICTEGFADLFSLVNILRGLVIVTRYVRVEETTISSADHSSNSTT